MDAVCIKKDVLKQPQMFYDDETNGKSIEDIVKELIDCSNNACASYIFNDRYHNILREICLQLSGTKPSLIYSGWIDFGIQLGIEKLLLECFRYNFQYEDPTYYTLAAFAAKENATLSRIIKALDDIKRHDVIIKIRNGILQMCREIESVENSNLALKIVLPRIPFISRALPLDDAKHEFKDIIKKIHPSNFDEIGKEKLLSNHLVKAQPFAQTVKEKTKYDVIVMLTFSSDAEKIATNLLTQLRSSHGSKKIGVLVLNEHLDKLCINPEQFIYDCFLQVNYVLPILTIGYMENISSKTDCNNNTTDNKYVKYIYSLMINHYIKSECKNLKTRCLIPDDSVKTVSKHHMMLQPIFQMWIKFSDIQKFIDKVL